MLLNMFQDHFGLLDQYLSFIIDFIILCIFNVKMNDSFKIMFNFKQMLL